MEEYPGVALYLWFGQQLLWSLLVFFALRRPA